MRVLGVCKIFDLEIQSCKIFDKSHVWLGSYSQICSIAAIIAIIDIIITITIFKIFIFIVIIVLIISVITIHGLQFPRYVKIKVVLIIRCTLVFIHSCELILS